MGHSINAPLIGTYWSSMLEPTGIFLMKDKRRVPHLDVEMRSTLSSIQHIWQSNSGGRGTKCRAIVEESGINTNMTGYGTTIYIPR